MALSLALRRFLLTGIPRLWRCARSVYAFATEASGGNLYLAISWLQVFGLSADNKWLTLVMLLLPSVPNTNIHLRFGIFDGSVTAGGAVWFFSHSHVIFRSSSKQSDLVQVLDICVAIGAPYPCRSVLARG